MSYEPVSYWQERGKTYEQDFRRTPAFEAQEAALGEFVARLSYASVLDVGCGFGRLAPVLLAGRENVAYSGIDVSADMLRGARRLVPAGDFVRSSLDDFDPAGRKWDLVLASEFLMHIPSADVGAAIAKLRSMATRHVITIDWTEPLPTSRRISPHNMIHDYAALFGDAIARSRVVGLQTIFRVRP